MLMGIHEVPGFIDQDQLSDLTDPLPDCQRKNDDDLKASVKGATEFSSVGGRNDSKNNHEGSFVSDVESFSGQTDAVHEGDKFCKKDTLSKCKKYFRMEATSTQRKRIRIDVHHGDVRSSLIYLKHQDEKPFESSTQVPNTKGSLDAWITLMNKHFQEIENCELIIE